MSRARLPIEIPQRMSLAGTVAAAIRKAIDAGYWKKFLPTERRLEEMFQVSRPTLRVALHLLAKEKLIEIRPGQGTRLLSRNTQKSGGKNRLVAVITHQPILELGLSYEAVIQMRSHLAKQDFDTEFVLCQTQGPAALRFIGNFLQRNRVFCCVLLSVGEQVQRWFVKHSIPALVLGSCHPNVQLPSLDFDNRSICRHAAGVFLNRGHRQLALLLPDSGLAGDLLSEQGFREAIDVSHDRHRTEGRIVRHDGTAASITAKLDTLFRSPAPPTALMMINPDEVFIVVMHLLKLGRSVPNSVSLISRDHDRIFELVSPAVAHYKPAPGAFEHRLSRLMLQMVGQGCLAPDRTLIVPKFFPGGTIKSLP